MVVGQHYTKLQRSPGITVIFCEYLATYHAARIVLIRERFLLLCGYWTARKPHYLIKYSMTLNKQTPAQPEYGFQHKTLIMRKP
jgi:hypothetical protein